jgi:hypothetical protein
MEAWCILKRALYMYISGGRRLGSGGNIGIYTQDTYIMKAVIWRVIGAEMLDVDIDQCEVERK